LETWIILEFCDRGTLDAAVRGGRFYSRRLQLLQQQSQQQPQLVGAESAALLAGSGGSGAVVVSPESKSALVATSSLPCSPSKYDSSITPRDIASIWACLKDVASGLDYLHGLGVMHGDLKPANVLLKSTTSDPRGFVCKVSDFGLSRVLDAGSTHVSTRSYGTIAFMPPELIRDGRLAR
jgi:serine/threonine protein kinase